MFVPHNVPHAFGNFTTKPAKLFFQSSVPGGHENYFDELLALLRRSDGTPSVSEVEQLRRRYDIEQLTPLRVDAPRLEAHPSHRRA